MIYYELIIKILICFILFLVFFRIIERLFDYVKPIRTDEIFFCSITYSLTDMLLEKHKVNETGIWILDTVITIIFLNFIYRGLLEPLTRRETNE